MLATRRLARCSNQRCGLKWRSAAPSPSSKHPAKRQKGENHAYRTLYLLVVSRSWSTGDTGSIPSTSCCGHLRSDWSACIASVCPADLPGTWLYLGSRLLGLWPGRLFLGSRHVGISAGSRSSLDSRLLGLGRRLLHLERRLLGTRRRLLWRN